MTLDKWLLRTGGPFLQLISTDEQAEQMFLSVKGMVHKHKDPRLISSTHIKVQAWGYRQRHRFRPASLAQLVSQQVPVRDAVSNRCGTWKHRQEYYRF